MKFALNHNIKDVLFPPIVEIKRLAVGEKNARGRSYVDLCQAVPDYAPAPEMVEYLRGRLPEDEAALYTADEGLLSVREAVCRRYRRLYEAKVSPANICLTSGASQAFWLAMVTLCAAGDEVIVQVPTYFDYDMALRMLGITCVYAPFDEARGGVPDVEAIAALVTPRTRAILVVSPSNPTGMVVPGDTLSALYDLAQSAGIALVLDETYADFIAGGKKPHDLLSREQWGDHFIQIMSFGKSYAMTGYRAGLLLASESFQEHALKAHDTMAICQSTPTQIALGYGLDHLDDWVAGKRRMMEGRHDRFRAEFCTDRNPFRLVTSGAFFAWVKHPRRGVSAWQVARELIETVGVVVLPGEIFGPGMADYLRVAFGNIGEEAIPEAVARFCEFN